MYMSETIRFISFYFNLRKRQSSALCSYLVKEMEELKQNPSLKAIKFFFITSENDLISPRNVVNVAIFS